MRGNKQHFGTVYRVTEKVVLPFESENKILKCGHSNESYCSTFPRVREMEGKFFPWEVGIGSKYRKF